MKLFLATPAYGGHVHVHYMQSMLGLQKVLAKENIDFEFFTIHFDSLIPRARNVCVMRFLQSDCTHMMFIDADIVFNPLHVVDMLRCDKDLVCGIYAKKALDFDKLKLMAPKADNMKELVEHCSRYNINLGPDVRVENGLMKADFAPTGFMLLRRDALRSFVESHPECRYKNDIRGYGFGEPCYDIFKCGVVNERYLSEDYYFCHSWKKSGREVYVDVRVSLGHVGSFTFYSNPTKVFL